MIVAALTAVAALTPAPADVAAIRQVVADSSAQPAPGCVVGIFRNGRPLAMTAAGMADIAAGKPLDADTLLYAASVSKQFTALAAALLAERGVLDLDADIRRYLPEMPVYDRPVTARMLLYHSSGIRDWLDLARMAGRADSSRVTKDEALALLFRQRTTNFTPGTAYLYSNGGFLLLAEIIERVSGMPFPDFVRDQILKPMGMTRSFVMNGRVPQDANIAHGYVATGNGFVIRDTYPLIGGSGGLMTTLNDLARYAYDIDKGHRVWTPRIHAIMEQAGTFTDSSPLVRAPGQQISAAGLAVGMRRGRYFIEHSGVAEGFRNQFARIPALGLTVATFCNRNDWSAIDLADTALDRAVGPILTPRPLDRVGGNYMSEEIPVVYTLSPERDGLHIRIGNAEKPVVLRPTDSPDRFSGEGLDLRIAPDGASFTLSSDRARGVRFVRASPPG